MAKTYGNKAQMEKEGSNFKPFKAGSYIARLSKIEVKEKKSYDGPIVPTLCLQFAPYEANARTAVMKDVDGATVKPLTRKLFLDINKVTMGFRENFTMPSKYRALVAALQDIDPNDDVPGPDELTVESAEEQLKEFFGDYLVLNVTAFEKSGKWRNKITDFLPVPEDFEADEVIEAQQEDAEKKRAAEKRNKPAASDDDDDEEEIEESTATSASDDDEGEDDDDEEEAPKPSKKKKNTKKALF